MLCVCVELNIEKICLVSPVMSGKFSLPWLMNGGEHIVGFIAIDTIETERYPDEQYQAIQIPILLLLCRLKKVNAFTSQN